jgi:hypothetical protein
MVDCFLILLFHLALVWADSFIEQKSYLQSPRRIRNTDNNNEDDKEEWKEPDDEDDEDQLEEKA